MWCWGAGFGGWGIFGMVLMAAFWIAVITLVVWSIRRLGQQTTVVANTGEPLDIAKQRYAKGEISKQEYEDIKRNLS
jgi:putative membrane protein